MTDDSRIRLYIPADRLAGKSEYEISMTLVELGLDVLPSFDVSQPFDVVRDPRTGAAVFKDKG